MRNRNLALKWMWIGAALFYLVLLSLTGYAGVWWSIWAWSIVATPLWTVTTRRNPTALRAGLLTLFLLAVAVPASIGVQERRGSDPPAAVYSPLLVAAVLLPILAPSIASATTRPSTDAEERPGFDV